MSHQNPQPGLSYICSEFTPQVSGEIEHKPCADPARGFSVPITGDTWAIYVGTDLAEQEWVCFEPGEFLAMCDLFDRKLGS